MRLGRETYINLFLMRDTFDLYHIVFIGYLESMMGTCRFQPSTVFNRITSFQLHFAELTLPRQIPNSFLELPSQSADKQFEGVGALETSLV